MKKIFFLFFWVFTLCFIPQASASEKPDPAELKALCNQTVLKIYKDILAVKDKYRELEQFGENVLYQNEEGIYAIVYDYIEEIKSPDGQTMSKKSFGFGVTIESLKSQTFTTQQNRFALTFPVLGVKIAAYQNQRLLRNQFNLKELIQQQGKSLFDFQQEFLPLRLYVRPLKESYKVKEDIQFEVVLTNVSKANMIVKDLTPQTLFFTVNGRAWGVAFWVKSKPKPRNRQEEVSARIEAQRLARKGNKKDIPDDKQYPGLLRAGESTSFTLKGESFLEPREFDVTATYSVLVDGINPTATARFRIVEE
jgi:hypothetical protein